MNSAIDKVYWSQVRKQVCEVNVALAEQIDRLSPGKSLPLYRIRYGFGEAIYNNNRFVIPDCSLSAEAYKALSYRLLPIGLFTRKSAEIYVDLPTRIIPIKVLQPGALFGLWQAFESEESNIALPWHMSAGLRSSFSLSKLNDNLGHKRIAKKYQVKQCNIQNIKDHWNLFTSVSNQMLKLDDWFCEVILFPVQWFNLLLTDSSWADLRHYCYNSIWPETMLMQRQMPQNLIWQQFLISVNNRGPRCCPYLLHTLKHLMMIGLGGLPCYEPAVCDQGAPIELIQKILVYDYGLDYFPTIMQPCHYDLDATTCSTYYSINEKSLINSFMRTRKIDNVMQISREVKSLLSFLYDEVMHKRLNIDSTLISRLIPRVQYDLFHHDFDVERQLLLSHQLPQLDQRFMVSAIPEFDSLPFCYSSSFLRGCVRLSY